MLRLAVTVLCCAAVCAGISAPSNQSQLQDYLYQFGYLPSTDLSRGVKRSASDMEQATKRLQKFMGLEVTGQLDQATMDLINTPRCGLKDVEVSDVNGQIVDGPANYTLWPYKWEDWQMPLKYAFINYSPDLPQDLIRSEIEASLALWTSVSGLSVVETTNSNEADLPILFAARFHGNCPAPFDGPNGVLAHALTPKGGDLHFDDDERFTVNNPSGYDFRYVAVHELGHSFGLLHSSVSGAIMQPAYTYLEDVQLHSDDIAGIQANYGSESTSGGGGTGGC